VRQEDLVDSVTVDAIIYNPGGSHLGAFPGPLLSANYQQNGDMILLGNLGILQLMKSVTWGIVTYLKLLLFSCY
jgi:hypothetical protein